MCLCAARAPSKAARAAHPPPRESGRTPPPRPHQRRKRPRASPPEAAPATGTIEPRRSGAAHSRLGLLPADCGLWTVDTDLDPAEVLRLLPNSLALLVELEQGEQRDRLGHAVGAL